MGTTIRIDIEALRAVARYLRGIAMLTQSHRDEPGFEGSSLETGSTDSLSDLLSCGEEIRGQASVLDARVDTAIIHNFGDGKNIPRTGVISYRVDGEDSSDPEDVKRQLGNAMASLGSDVVLHDLDEGGRERIKLLRSQLVGWSIDRDVMGSFFDLLTPGGSLRVMSVLGNRASSAFGSSEEGREESKSALNFMKIGLGRATQGWSEGKAERFGQDMVSASMGDADGFLDSGLHEAMMFVAHKNSTASGAFISGALNRFREIEGGMGGPIRLAGTPAFLRELIGENDDEWASDIGDALLCDLSLRPESQ